MKILVLDDDRTRHDVFDRRFVNHEVHHAYTVQQFKSAYSRVKRFDVVCFDHDLGTPETGLDAARFLTRDVDKNCWPERCLVHSWNPSGGLRIFDELFGAGISVGRRPFGVDLKL